MQDLGSTGDFRGGGKGKKREKEDNKFGTVKARPFSKCVMKPSITMLELQA